MSSSEPTFAEQMQAAIDNARERYLDRIREADGVGTTTQAMLDEENLEAKGVLAMPEMQALRRYLRNSMEAKVTGYLSVTEVARRAEAILARLVDPDIAAWVFTQEDNHDEQ